MLNAISMYYRQHLISDLICILVFQHSPMISNAIVLSTKPSNYTVFIFLRLHNTRNDFNGVISNPNILTFLSLKSIQFTYTENQLRLH